MDAVQAPGDVPEANCCRRFTLSDSFEHLKPGQPYFCCSNQNLQNLIRQIARSHVLHVHEHDHSGPLMRSNHEIRAGALLTASMSDSPESRTKP